MFTWKILATTNDADNFITSAKYYVKAQDEENTVDTEGYWQFPKCEIISPFNEVNEEQVIGWIKEKTTENGQNSIELNLQKQLEALKIQNSLPSPWVKPTFKPTL
jgi:hypothetical protein